MAEAKVAENHGDWWGLTLYLKWSICTSIPTWTHWQDSLAAEALNLKISSLETSLKLSQRPSQSASLLESQWKLRQQHQNIPMEGSHCWISVSKEINKPKRAGLWESQSGILVGKFRSFQLGHISLLHTEQESQESWTQGKIHIQQNCNKGFEYL